MSEKVELSRQQRKSQETREKIFRAAKKILQKKGYEELSIKNICEEAGVSNGSFYHHFKTKDDLLSYYIEEQPTINPDLLEIPENAGVGVLRYEEPGIECSNQNRASLSDRDSADVCGEGDRSRSGKAECQH